MGPRMLRSIRVVDLAGPSAGQVGRILGDLGAEVVMVESPGSRQLRAHPPTVAAGGEQLSPHFLYMAAGKKSVTVDVERPEGYELLCALVGRSDVVIVTERTDSLRGRGLDYDTLSQINPALVFVSVTPFGASGPRRRWDGSDLVAWASSGAISRVSGVRSSWLILAKKRLLIWSSSISFWLLSASALWLLSNS
jgi:crotonobetainyl-CoA:carnitine CoA-transferase CaiB-like acyl-CoA transferase